MEESSLAHFLDDISEKNIFDLEKEADKYIDRNTDEIIKQAKNNLIKDPDNKREIERMAKEYEIPEDHLIDFILLKIAQNTL